MLLRFNSMDELDFSKLMEIYRESNTENVSYFFPDCTDIDAGRKQVEEKFYSYLKNDFFSIPGNRYYVYEKDGVWLSAIRLFPVPEKAGKYYAEALETRPERRREGNAEALFKLLFEELSDSGDFEISDSVSKTNTASLRTHLSSGFRICQENSICILNGYENPNAYGLSYNYSKETEEHP